MNRANTAAPTEWMIGTDRRYFKNKKYAEECKFNLEAVGYTAHYEYVSMAKYAPHKITFWLSMAKRQELQL